MENFVKQSFLYDFYGELLTEHQKEIYEAYVLENLSLAEIAQEYGVSRQGVHDIIKRCNLALEEYESKLRLFERFQQIKKKVEDINSSESLKETKKISSEILELL